MAEHRMLLDTFADARRTWDDVVGLQPDVAFAMVHMGLTLEGVTTRLDLEEGLDHLNRNIKSAAYR